MEIRHANWCRAEKGSKYPKVQDLMKFDETIIPVMHVG